MYDLTDTHRLMDAYDTREDLDIEQESLPQDANDNNINAEQVPRTPLESTNANFLSDEQQQETGEAQAASLSADEGEGAADSATNIKRAGEWGMIWRHVAALLWKNRKLYYEERKTKFWVAFVCWPLLQIALVFFLSGSLAVSRSLHSTVAPLSSWVMFALRYDTPHIYDKVCYKLGGDSRGWCDLDRTCRPNGQEASFERLAKNMVKCSAL